MSKRSRERWCPKFPGLYLPADLNPEDILWLPDETERKLAGQLRKLRSFHLEIQRSWLLEQNQRLVAIAHEIDEFKRKEELNAEFDRAEKWFTETVEREQEETEKLLAAYQKQLEAK